MFISRSIGRVWLCVTVLSCVSPDGPARAAEVGNLDALPEAARELPTAEADGTGFYVVGARPEEGIGLDRPIQIAFFRFKADQTAPVTISVFDPDTSGDNDLADSEPTTTQFSVYGGNGAYTDANARLVFPDPDQKGTLLAAKAFSNENEAKWFSFRPFRASDGEIIGDWSYFKVVARVVRGSGRNWFRLAGSPQAGGEGFCFNAALCVPGKISTEMYLGVPEVEEKVIGVTSPMAPDEARMYFKTPERSVRLTQPSDGGWSRYDIALLAKEKGRRSAYRIEKISDRASHLVFTFTGKDGHPLKLFSAQEPVRPSTPESVAVADTEREPAPTPAAESTTVTDEPEVETEPEPARTAAVASTETDGSGVETGTTTAAGQTDAASEQPRSEPVAEPEPRTTEPIDPCLTFVLDASRSFDPDNNALTYEWDFGDGSQKIRNVKASHTYRKPGQYTITLKVDDGTNSPNAVSRVSQEITANARPIPVLTAPEYLVTGEAGIFDARGSRDTPGDLLSFNWEFGDGKTADDSVATHAYTKGGTYTAKLTVMDSSKTNCSSAAIEHTIIVNTPPVAVAGPDVVINLLEASQAFEVKLDASKSHDADGDELTYTWDFGDGKPVRGAKATRIFSKGGQYEAKLVVQDRSKGPINTATDSVKISLNHAPQPVFQEPGTAQVGKEARFDASESTDVDGDALACFWEFGDGESSETGKAGHTYARPGDYAVTLTVDDGQGTAVSRQTLKHRIRVVDNRIAVRMKPLAPGAVGEVVTFEAERAGDDNGHEIVYRWDFGDGQQAEGQIARYVYRKGGLYTVSLVGEMKGEPEVRSTPVRQELRINTSPEPSLAILNDPCCPDRPIQFDASGSADADGDAVAYLWDFGDGQTSKEAAPVQIYKKGGIYKVTLTVTDASGLPGCSKSESRVLRINSSPIAVISIGN